MSTLFVQNIQGVSDFTVDGQPVDIQKIETVDEVFAHANSGYAQANTGYTQANTAFGQANTVFNRANVIFNHANSSFEQANTSRSSANLAYSQANAAYSAANTTSPIGQQTIWIPAAAMYARTSNGAASGTVETSTNKVMIKTLDFDTTTQEFAQFAIQMPKSWNESSLICQFVWSHGATTTNFGVVWAVEAVSFNTGDSLDAAFGTAVQVANTGGTANTIYITSETSALTVAGTPTAEEYVVFQVKRVPADASDTMAIDARLHGVKIHYTTDAAKDD